MEQDDQLRAYQSPGTKQLLSRLWKYGWISYGGPIAHVAMFRKEFVDQLGWFPTQQFDEMYALCQSVPGPTSTQLLILIATRCSRRLSVGILAFVLWSLPSYVFLSLAALTLSSSQVPALVSAAMLGFRAAALAIIAQAFWGFSKRFHSEPFYLALIALSCIGGLLIPGAMASLAILGAMGLCALLFDSAKISQNCNFSCDLDNRLVGKLSAVLLVVLLATTWALRAFAESSFTVLADVFYRIGTVVIGGGHVILPLMKQELQGGNYFTQEQFWNGFAFISCLPGPLFNLSVYVGTLVAGLPGGAVAFLSLNAPSFLLIWAILPYYRQYRSNELVAKFLKGVCAASVGLIAFALVDLTQSLMGKRPWLLGCLSVGSLLLLFREWPVVVLLIGAGLVSMIAQYLS